MSSNSCAVLKAPPLLDRPRRRWRLCEETDAKRRAVPGLAREQYIRLMALLGAEQQALTLSWSPHSTHAKVHPDLLVYAIQH